MSPLGSQRSATPASSAWLTASNAPHDLHVLLRHRLLRQPGGFEGLVRSREATAVSDLPSRKSHRPATIASSLRSLDLAGHRARDGILRAPALLGSMPMSSSRSPRPTQSQSSAARIASTPPTAPAGRDTLDLVRRRLRRVRSRRARSPHSAPHNLHVLLRHRLLRQPGGFEGFACDSERRQRTILPSPNVQTWTPSCSMLGSRFPRRDAWHTTIMSVPDRRSAPRSQADILPGLEGVRQCRLDALAPR